MIESTFLDTIKIIRNFTNSINRNDIEQSNEVFTVLSNIQKRISFMMQEDIDCKVLENRFIKELRKLTKRLVVKSNNKSVYLDKLQKNIDYLTWVNKKFDIGTGSRKYTVAQKEIFYAYLGENIGSEQNGRRPVIILQNDTGNAKGNTTIIAPVTTHKKRIKWDNSKQKYYIEIANHGSVKRKYLDFYEIPLRLQGENDRIHGFVNIMHIREIDRKRIDSRCVGMATDKCYEDIIKAINKNLC